MKTLRLLLAIWLPAIGGCYLFCDNGRPCTPDGECLPNFTCIDGLCQPAGVKQIGDECFETGECISGAVCSVAHCSDEEKKACTSNDDCASEDFICRSKTCRCIRECRPGCKFPHNDDCAIGMLCFQDEDQDLGFCQEGHCGKQADGTNLGECESTEACIEFHGVGSGLCTPMCTLLQQNLDCNLADPPAGVLCCAGYQSCEHFVGLWEAAINPDLQYGICFDSGPKAEGEPCDANGYCQRGLFCDYTNTCRMYCNRNVGQAPVCGSGYLCTPLPGGQAVPFGTCEPQ